MPAPKRNREAAKLDYEPVSQWGRDGVDSYLIDQGRVRDNVKPSRDGVGHDQPDPWRHLDDQYKPQYPKN